MTFDDAAQAPTEGRRRWSVHECPNGCVHLRLERQMLTFSASEFAQLVQLLSEAYVRLSVRSAAETTPH